MADPTSATRYDCFVTPIWHFPPDPAVDNAALEQAVRLEREKDAKGTNISNLGGWQSQMNLQEVEAFAAVVNHIRSRAAAACRDWGLDFLGHPPHLVGLWANVNRCGDANQTHHHWGFPVPNFKLLSGAYYVRCTSTSGAIQLLDERPSSKYVTCYSLPFAKKANNFIGEAITIRPQVGELLLFPAWLDHRVQAGEAGSEEERISLSFNFAVPREVSDKLYETHR
ncbi:MAG: TIGR02466 family protein [Phycisphaerae bacterium]|nr:TIGR02466 family protein [Phycisphaerae bacterium]